MKLIQPRIINSHALIIISFYFIPNYQILQLKNCIVAFFLNYITSSWRRNLEIPSCPEGTSRFFLREVMVYPQCVIQGTGHYALACSLHLIYCTDTMQDGYTITHWGLQIHIGGSKESRGYPSAQGSHSSIRSKRQLLAALLHLSPLTSHKSVMVLLNKQVQTPILSCA